MKEDIKIYKDKLFKTLNDEKLYIQIEKLFDSIFECWKNKRQVYICGNGGSAGNAIHIANDYTYGAGITNKTGIRIEALSSNPAVLTCLANDLGYENIYSEQLKVKGNEGDLLIILSGSGNSKNVVKALEVANALRMKTFSILGFDGGKCLSLSNNSIHFQINDMQISEDLQLVVMHMIMKKLSKIKI